MIDIDGLTEAELLDLSRRVVARLRVVRDVQALAAMQAFRIGDRVSFEAARGPMEGVLTRFNRTTVTVVNDAGLHWNISPTLLQKVVPTPGDEAGPVIDDEVLS